MADIATPQLSSITSESLQAKIRALLPSQQGFGADLAASNVITPIIDLTSAAEGSDVPAFLQQALDFGSITSTTIDSVVTNQVILSTPGFYRVFMPALAGLDTGKTYEVNLFDGASSKNILDLAINNAGVGATGAAVSFDNIIFLASGVSLRASLSATQTSLLIVTRQIADLNGNLVNPTGFTPQ